MNHVSIPNPSLEPSPGHVPVRHSAVPVNHLCIPNPSLEPFPGHVPVRPSTVPVNRFSIPNPSLEPLRGLGLAAARQEAAKIKFAFIYSIEGCRFGICSFWMLLSERCAH